jgi:hypothetical protein
MNKSKLDMESGISKHQRLYVRFVWVEDTLIKVKLGPIQGGKVDVLLEHHNNSVLRRVNR